MSPRARTYVFVALAAAATSGLLVAAVAFTRTSSPHAQPASAPPPRAPTLVLDLGVRTDPETVALRRANALYASGKRRAAGRIFARFSSVPAKVGAAMAAWPHGTLSRLETIADRHPASALALLHLGLARIAGGETAAARAAWRQALARDPNTESAVQAESLLYPRFAPGRPSFVPSFGVPPEIARLSPPKQLAALARARDVRARLLYGSALQRLGRSLSAEREFATAARLAPTDAEAQAAAAVGRFSKAKPAASFSRLGPLARRFPRSQSVRFHLGELLIWIGQLREARRQLDLAVRAGPSTPLGQTARQFLKQLPKQ